MVIETVGATRLSLKGSSHPENMGKEKITQRCLRTYEKGMKGYRGSKEVEIALDLWVWKMKGPCR